MALINARISARLVTNFIISHFVCGDCPLHFAFEPANVFAAFDLAGSIQTENILPQKVRGEMALRLYAADSIHRSGFL